MNYVSDTVSKDFSPSRVIPPLAFLLALLVGCSSMQSEQKKETQVLSTRSGDTMIQVTESDQGGVQIIRIKTTYRGEESEIVLQIDQPIYSIEIPLSIEQVIPAAAGRTSVEGNFEDLLIAQYLEKSQEAMMDGDYNLALRQINLVLLIRPNHVRSHEMRGSIYYAMGNYQLANEEWEEVLALDPSNHEVNEFMEFLRNQSVEPQPSLPGSE